MSLVQVKYWSHVSLTKKQVKEVLFIKARQQSWKKDFYRDLMLKLDKSSTQALLVENYEIMFSRSDYMHIHEYLCRVSFLTTPNIYKNYFKSRHKRCKVMQNDNTCILWPEAEIALVHHSLCRSYRVFTPRVLWPRYFLIFIVDELMNWRTLQPTFSSSWCVSHVLESVHHWLLTY